MSRKILYLVNPISGTKEKSGVINLISRKTKERGIPFEILSTNSEGKYDHIRDRVINDGVTDVVVAGGDGTVSAVAASLSMHNVRIGVIPMGSGNGLALTARIPTAPSRALEIIFNGASSFIDGFTINGHFSCMLCGIGFDAQVAHDFAKQKRRGLQTYIKTSFINFFKASAYPFIITSRDKVIETNAFFISIANSNQFGNNFTIAPLASLSDGLLDVVIVNKMNKFMLPFSILGQVTGFNAFQKLDDHVPIKNIVYFQTTQLTIENPGLAPIHIDGDPKVTTAKFIVEVLPNAFQLLQPF